MSHTLDFARSFYSGRSTLKQQFTNFKNLPVAHEVCAPKLSKQEMLPGNVRLVNLTLLASFARSALRKAITKDIKYGSRRMFQDAAIAEILMHGVRMDSALIIKGMQHQVKCCFSNYHNT